MAKKILFIDRDGTLIEEPEDKQVDRLDKLYLKKNVIPALLKLQQAGYTFVMVSNQDGMGTSSFTSEEFEESQQFLLTILNSQGIDFESIFICPHFESDACECRKPRLGLVMEYLRNGKMDFENSYVIGDRITDVKLAINMGIKSIQYMDQSDWLDIAYQLTTSPRCYQLTRVTNETTISVSVDLDNSNTIQIATGIGFFDHMLEQLAKHGGFGLVLKTSGDLIVDEHHTVEDTAIAIGDAIRLALGDKLGIYRYGFTLPMDEALAQVAIDLSGRSYFVFNGRFEREAVGSLPTELIPHFFRSLADSLCASLHITISGENTHHMIEGIFKCVGRVLRQAITKQGYELPSTKGIL